MLHVPSMEGLGVPIALKHVAMKRCSMNFENKLLFICVFGGLSRPLGRSEAKARDRGYDKRTEQLTARTQDDDVFGPSLFINCVANAHNGVNTFRRELVWMRKECRARKQP